MPFVPKYDHLCLHGAHCVNFAANVAKFHTGGAFCVTILTIESGADRAVKF